MARKKARKNGGPHIYWRNGRAYADLRAYEDVGGGREALAEPNATWGTKDPEIAEALFAARIQELQAKRKGRVGIEPKRSIALVKLARDHLVLKARAGRTSDSHMEDLEQRLRSAIEYFGAGRDPRTIEPEDVRGWAEALARGGRRKPGTVRHYLNALSGLYRRAQEGLYVDPGYNPVAMLNDKPTGHWRAEAAFFEAHDATLVLEAAKVLDARDRGPTATPGLYAIIATLLLTGGRWSEVAGLDVGDVSFDRDLITFRPNAHRGLKTRTSRRTVPLMPQLRDILQTWMYGGETPRTSGLLFPAAGGGMLRKPPRKALAALERLCGMEPGEIRTRRFRHTFCAMRLQCVQRIVRPGRDPSDPDSWDYVEVARDTVAREMGHGGDGLVKRIYGHAPRNPVRSEVVEYRVERHRDRLGERLTALAAARV